MGAQGGLVGSCRACMHALDLAFGMKIDALASGQLVIDECS